MVSFMKLNYLYFIAKLLLLSMISFRSLVVHADLTKREAFDILKSQGVKWQMIRTISEDADIKVQETDAALRPKMQLILKQFYARINPIQYGGDDKLVTDQVGFGTTGVEFSWPLMDPSTRSEAKIAGIKAASSRQQVLQNETDLTALMLFEYLNVQKLRRQILVMDANIERSQLIFKLAKSKNKVGAGIPLDIARAKNLYEFDRLKKINAFNKYLKAQHDLATTLGLEKLKTSLSPLVAKKLAPEQLRELLDRSLEIRPDLKTAELNVAAAHELVDDSKKIIFPKLTLLGEVGTTQPTVLGLPARTATGLVGLVLTIPIESGGLITAKQREALSLSNKADLQLKQTKLEILSQVKEAMEQIISTEEALVATENNVATVKEENEIAEKRFFNGVSNILDYTSSHTNFSAAQDTLTEAMFNLEAAKLNYYRTLGSFEGYFKE